MKILFALLLFSSTCYGQYACFDFSEKPGLRALSLTLPFVSGYMYGTAETLQFHYHEFKKVHPGSDDIFFDPQVSWQNKYKNGDPLQGQKFLGSTTFLSFTTDGYHLTRMIERAGWLGTITITLFDNRDQKFIDYLVQYVVNFLSYSAGFYLSYKIIYK